nr:MAG TPA: hypothetical protein [Caudoviricetes sp.]
MSNFEYGLGMVNGQADPRDYVYGVTTEATAVSELPEKYEPYIKAKVHNQGKINNCATHALTASLENVLGGKLAFNWIYGNRRYSDHKGQGTIERDLLKAAQKDGLLVWDKYPSEEEMPESMNRFEKEADALLPTSRKITIKNYWQLPTFDSVRQALYDGKIVQIGFQVFSNIAKLDNYNTILEPPTINKDGQFEESWIGGHEVWAIGYKVLGGRRVLKLRNSWGDDWGMSGCFYIPEEFFTWSEKYGFPIPLIDAWAFEFSKDETDPVTPDEPNTPAQKDGWYKKNEKWRYLKDGKDATGWVFANKIWYYLDPDGNMVANDWRYVDNRWYYLTASGAMSRGWRKIDGLWYYFNLQTDKNGPNGAMLTGFQEIGGKLYYLNEKGAVGYPLGAMIITDSSGAINI